MEKAHTLLRHPLTLSVEKTFLLQKMQIICDVAYSLYFISSHEIIIIRSYPYDVVRALEENQITRDATCAEEPLSVEEATSINAASQ